MVMFEVNHMAMVNNKRYVVTKNDVVCYIVMTHYVES